MRPEPRAALPGGSAWGRRRALTAGQWVWQVWVSQLILNVSTGGPPGTSHLQVSHRLEETTAPGCGRQGGRVSELLALPSGTSPHGWCPAPRGGPQGLGLRVRAPRLRPVEVTISWPGLRNGRGLVRSARSRVLISGGSSPGTRCRSRCRPSRLLGGEAAAVPLWAPGSPALPLPPPAPASPLHPTPPPPGLPGPVPTLITSGPF